MQLDSGDYTIHSGPNGRIQVSFAGNIRNAAAKLATSGTHANLAIRETSVFQPLDRTGEVCGT
jgi:hypothetical protein